MESLKSKNLEIEHLQEALAKATADLKIERVNTKTSQRKINFTKNVTEKRLLESITNPEGFIADPLLIGVYSATLDEDEIKLDDANIDVTAEDGRSRRDIFLKSMEEKVDHENSEHKERFQILKNKIIEKVKTTQHSRSRSRSCSGSSRTDSKKRELSSESKGQELGKSPVRPRTSGIPLANK